MEIVSIKPKITKERLVNQFVQEVGGVASYWNKIPVEQLKNLHEVIENNHEAKAALINLIQQLKEAKETNSRLNQKNFGLNQAANKYERVASNLVKANALLEQQKNELLRQIKDMVNCLNDYDKSEIYSAIKKVCDYINLYIK